VTRETERTAISPSERRDRPGRGWLPAFASMGSPAASAPSSRSSEEPRDSPPSLARSFVCVVRRDLRLAVRESGDAAMIVGFFVLAVILFPSSKATSGLTSSGYLPRIPELPNWSFKPVGNHTVGSGGTMTSGVGIAAGSWLSARGIDRSLDFRTPTCLRGQTFFASLYTSDPTLPSTISWLNWE